MHTIYLVSVYEKVHARECGIAEANHDLGRGETKQDHAGDEANQGLGKNGTNHDIRRDEANNDKLSIEDKVFQTQSLPFTDSATDNTVRVVILFYS